jgi:hypothetical protein
VARVREARALTGVGLVRGGVHKPQQQQQQQQLQHYAGGLINLHTVDKGKWLSNPNHIYIGRDKGNIRGSKWGNPFTIKSSGSRQTAIRSYEQYIRKNPCLLNSLSELRGKVLGCWCSPLQCHGDIIRTLLGEMEGTSHITDNIEDPEKHQSGSEKTNPTRKSERKRSHTAKYDEYVENLKKGENTGEDDQEREQEVITCTCDEKRDKEHDPADTPDTHEFFVPRGATCRCLRSAEEIERNRQAAIAKRQLREKEHQLKQGDDKLDDLSTPTERIPSNLEERDGEGDKKETEITDTEKEGGMKVVEEPVVSVEDAEGNVRTVIDSTEQELLMVDSVLSVLDELDDLLADDNVIKIDEIHTVVEEDQNCENCETLKVRVQDIELEKEYTKKKNEQLEIMLNAQESLLKSKNEKILDLTDTSHNPQHKEIRSQESKALEKKEEEVANLTKVLEAKMEEIKEREKCIDDLRTQVRDIQLIKMVAEESRKELKDKADKIQELQGRLQDKDIEQEVKNKEDKIEELQAMLKKKDSEMDGLKKQVVKYEEHKMKDEEVHQHKQKEQQEKWEESRRTLIAEKEDIIKEMQNKLEKNDTDQNKLKKHIEEFSLSAKQNKLKIEEELAAVQKQKNEACGNINDLLSKLRNKDEELQQMHQIKTSLEQNIRNNVDAMRMQEQDLQQQRDENMQIKSNIKVLKQNQEHPSELIKDLNEFKKQVIKRFDELDRKVNTSQSQSLTGNRSHNNNQPKPAKSRTNRIKDHYGTNVTPHSSYNNTGGSSSDSEEDIQQMRVVPGRKTFVEAAATNITTQREIEKDVLKDKKTIVFSTSITKHFDERRFDAAYSHGTARFQRWHGGRAEHIKHYVATHLKKEKPDTVVIQIGGNDLQRGDRRDPATITEIANDIIETARICRSHDVQHIFVGGVPVRRPKWTWDICKDLNNSLKGQCTLNNFNFYDNSDITTHDLYDGVHLNDTGVSKMANNMLLGLKGYFSQLSN